VEWRPSWQFKGEETEERICAMLRGEPGLVLHACSGASKLGDVTLDMSHAAAAVRADATAMPFRPGSFGAVVMDPPYNVPGPVKARLVHECLRVTRQGGVFILHAPWFGALARLVLEDCAVRVDEGGRHWPRAPVMLTKWRVLRSPGRASARWRRPPNARDAARAGMRVGALAEVLPVAG
jgi:SAM-dependent methyltransferase